MARRNIYELLLTRQFDPQEELENLKSLFEEEEILNRSSFLDVIEASYFRDFPGRGRFLSLSTMLDEIEEIAINDSYSPMESLLLYCELLDFVINQCRYTQIYSHYYGVINERARLIEEQIERILDATGYKWVEISEDKRIVVEKNPIATEAAELANNDNDATNIMEYNHFSLKGDIDGKKKILISLADSIEPILNEFRKKKIYPQLASDIGFILNNCNIRHNNIDGANAKEFVKKMEPEELEQWYDKAYNCILAVIILNEQLNTNKDIHDLKAQYNL